MPLDTVIEQTSTTNDTAPAASTQTTPTTPAATEAPQGEEHGKATPANPAKSPQQRAKAKKEADEKVQADSRAAFQKYQAQKSGDEPEAQSSTDPTEPEATTPKQPATQAEQHPETPEKTPDAAPTNDNDTTRYQKTAVKAVDGKDVEVTMAQARRALLRARLTPELIERWTLKQQLEKGADLFVQQQEQDRIWSQAQQRRPAEGAAAAPQTPAPGAAPTEAATGATPPTPPSQEAAPQQQHPAVSPVAQVPPAVDSYLESMRELLGDDGVNTLKSALSAATQETTRGLSQQLKQMQDQTEAVANAYIGQMFTANCKSLEAEFPQLKDQKVREEVWKTANSIALSGRHGPQPLDKMPEIVRESSYVVLGKQQQETTARKLLDRQRAQENNQPERVTTAAKAPVAALTPQEASRRVWEHSKKHESVEAGDKLAGQLTRVQ